jgi:hypothetical protein
MCENTERRDTVLNSKSTGRGIGCLRTIRLCDQYAPKRVRYEDILETEAV